VVLAKYNCCLNCYYLVFSSHFADVKASLKKKGMLFSLLIERRPYAKPYFNLKVFQEICNIVLTRFGKAVNACLRKIKNQAYVTLLGLVRHGISTPRPSVCACSYLY
jgi:hypothetical protein